MTQIASQIELQCINAIRALSADAVEKANSGHPGAPMGMAPMAHVLWSRFLKHNPANPNWLDRDRFILSAGHASVLLYSLLHLTGYKVSLNDIKNFRQWGSVTPGHPELGVTEGVETTTGPLGQGFANAVGMAMAERYLANYFNKPEMELVNHNTYVIVSDGDLMEGISYEAASFAGHQKLGKIICLYDDNQITIDGGTDLSFTEDVTKRFEACGWHVQEIEDGDTDLKGIEKAIEFARKNEDQPSIIRVKTTIGYGSPNKANTPGSHGAPLGADEVRASKKQLELPEDEDFNIPKEVLTEYRKALDKGEAEESKWNTLWAQYKESHPDLAKEWVRFNERVLPKNISQILPQFSVDEAIATRSASGKALNDLAKAIPNLISGSADLAGSVGTLIKDGGNCLASNPLGRNIPYGVREHSMGAIMNGMTLHGGVIVTAGTFLIFSDYMKPSIRLAALMKLPVIYLFSHDSIALGEDGPTHQPVEQITGLRAIPNLTVIRPADANEAVSAWIEALKKKDGPTALILTRQKVPILDLAIQNRTQGVSQGAQIVYREKNDSLDLIIIASGSEVSICIEAAKILELKKLGVRVVSMASWEIFEAQTTRYQNMILDPQCKKRLAVEAAAAQGWGSYVGDEGDVVSMTRFGASAPGATLLEKFGFTPELIAEKAIQLFN